MSTIHIYCDGGWKPMQNTAYGSFHVYLVGKDDNGFDTLELKRIKTLEFDASKVDSAPKAEYETLMEVINYLLDPERKVALSQHQVVIHMDSALVHGQTTQGWKVKELSLLAYVNRAKQFFASAPYVKLFWINGDEMKKILGH